MCRPISGVQISKRYITIFGILEGNFITNLELVAYREEETDIYICMPVVFNLLIRVNNK